MLTNRDLKYIQEALKKYEKGQSTPAESHFVETYLDYLDEWNKNIDPLSDLSAKAKFELEQEIKLHLFKSIHKDNGVVRELKKHREFSFKWMAAAAIIFVICGTAAYWFLFNPYPKQGETTAYIQQDIPHGTNRAILKLANGQNIVLDSVQGDVVQVGNLKVNNDRGTLNYKGKTQLVESHTLSTPRGGHYKLQLPDGTNVWMNAASSITYPTAFNGLERHVAITGEVYMEVAKDPLRPFTVQTNQMQVVVLGTHFNVNAYPDESGIKTTLLEGAVKVVDGNKMQMLVPGEQALVSGNTIKVSKDISIAEVVAWKDGLFKFENADIETIMRQLSRWYDIDVVYEGKRVKEYFNASVPRDVPVSKVLTLLELTGLVHFTIDGRKIIVKH